MSEQRKFGLVVGGILAGIGSLLVVFQGWPGASFIAAGLLLVLLGMLAPRSLTSVNIWWMRVAGAIGWFNTRVILGLVFLLVLPVARLYLILRGNDPMRRTLDREAETYWVDLDDTPFEPESLEHPF